MTQINKGVELLKQGGVIIFPTDTVWGIGASIQSPIGIKKLYQVKGREFTKPSQVLVKNLSMAGQYGEFSQKARELAQEYWPGALTLVVPAKMNRVDPLVRAGGETVGLRAPDHDIIQSLIDGLDCGIVASSANFAGGEAPKVFSAIDPLWLKQVDYVVKNQEAGGEPSSTVVKVIGAEIEVIRQGAISL